jgi:hypothetical protein
MTKIGISKLIPLGDAKRLTKGVDGPLNNENNFQPSYI